MNCIEMAEKIKKIKIGRDNEFPLGAMAHPVDINKIADFVLAEIAKAKEEVLNNPRTYIIGKHPPFQYILSEEEMNRVIHSAQQEAKVEVAKPLLEFTEKWIDDCEPYPSVVATLQIKVFKMYKKRLDKIIAENSEKD